MRTRTDLQEKKPWRGLISFFLTLIAAIPSFILAGCSSVEETRLQRSVSDSITRQIEEFNSADAKVVAVGRLKDGNAKFLGYAGEPQEPSFVPGLSQGEIQRLTEAKRYQWEVFYYYHGRSELGSSTEQKALWNVRLNYAERVNHEILLLLEQEKRPAS